MLVKANFSAKLTILRLFANDNCARNYLIVNDISPGQICHFRYCVRFCVYHDFVAVFDLV